MLLGHYDVLKQCLSSCLSKKKEAEASLAVIPRNRRNEHSRLGHQNLQPFFQLLDS